MRGRAYGSALTRPTRGRGKDTEDAICGMPSCWFPVFPGVPVCALPAQSRHVFLLSTDTSRPPLWSVTERVSPGETQEESVMTVPVSAAEVME